MRRALPYLTSSLLGLVSIALIFLIVQLIFPAAWPISRRANLSSVSRKTLDELPSPIQGYLIIPDGIQRREAEELLNRYALSAPQKFKYRWIDPYTSPALVEKFNLKSRSGFVAESTGNEPRFETANRLDESAVTGALLRLSHPTDAEIEVDTEHGERSLTDSQESGLSKFREDIISQGLQFSPSARNNKPALRPKDVLFMAGPTKDLTTEEDKKIREFIDGGGTLLLFLDFNTPDSYANLLRAYGMAIPRDVIYDAASDPRHLAPVFVHGLTYDISHPMLKNFGGETIFRMTRPVSRTEERPKGFVTTELIHTGPTAFLLPRNSLIDQKTIDTSKLTYSSYSLAAATSAQNKDEAQSNPPRLGKLIVVGNTDFASNEVYSFVPGNRQLLRQMFLYAIGPGSANPVLETVESPATFPTASWTKYGQLIVLLGIPISALLLALHWKMGTTRGWQLYFLSALTCISGFYYLITTRAHTSVPPVTPKPLFSSIQVSDISSANITQTKSGEITELRHQDGLWVLEAKQRRLLQTDVMNSLFKNLADLYATPLYSQSNAPLELADFGLQPPLSTVEVRLNDGRLQILEVGNPLPDKSGQYVKSPTLNIGRVDRDLNILVSPSFENYYEKRLVPLAPDQCRTCQFKKAGKPPIRAHVETVVAKEGNTITGGSWSLDAGEPPTSLGLGDTAKISAVLSSWTSFSGAPLGPPPRTAFSPQATWEFFGTNDLAPIMIEIGPEADGHAGEFIVRRSPGLEYFRAKIDPTFLQVKDSDWQDRRIAGFSVDDAMRVDFTVGGQDLAGSLESAQWSLVRPKQLNANVRERDDIVREMLRQMANCEWQQSVSERKLKNKKWVTRARLRVFDKKDQKIAELTLGPRMGTGSLVKGRDGNGLFLVSPDPFEVWSTLLSRIQAH